jgi:hypothetical protein
MIEEVNVEQEFNNGLKIPTGAASGDVLVSDGSGNVSWKAPDVAERGRTAIAKGLKEGAIAAPAVGSSNVILCTIEAKEGTAALRIKERVSGKEFKWVTSTSIESEWFLNWVVFK